jgi:hypothetical protein
VTRNHHRSLHGAGAAAAAATSISFFLTVDVIRGMALSEELANGIDEQVLRTGPLLLREFVAFARHFFKQNN